MEAKEVKASYIERFKEIFSELSTNENGCILWNKSEDSKGYGVYRVQLISGSYYKLRAHKLSYLIYNGVIADGLVVRHTCDNPHCCNPKHLILGTVQQNNQDSVDRKTRFAKAKFSKEDVLEIRRLKEKGLSFKKLASRFNTSISSIQGIVNRLTYSYI